MSTPENKIPGQMGLRDAIYQSLVEEGYYDPNSDYNRTKFAEGLSTFDRYATAFGRGLVQGGSLGFAGRDAIEGRRPGHIEGTDIAAFAGNIIGGLPAAMATGAGVGALAARFAPTVAARLAMGGAGAAASGLGARMAQAGARNVLEGAPLTALEMGRSAVQDGNVSAKGLARVGATQVAADMLLGGALGSRKPKLDIGTKGDAGFVDIAADGAPAPRPDAPAPRALPPGSYAMPEAVLDAPLSPRGERAPTLEADVLGFESNTRALPPADPTTRYAGEPPVVQDLGADPRVFYGAPKGNVVRYAGEPLPDALQIPATTTSRIITPAPEGSTLPAGAVDRTAPDAVTAVRRTQPTANARAADPVPVAEATARSLGMDPEAPTAPAAPVAALDAPSAGLEPAMPSLVNPGEFRSPNSRAAAHALNQAQGDRATLFAELMNLQDPALKIPPQDRAALIEAAAARLQQMPAPEAAPRFQPRPPPPAAEPVVSARDLAPEPAPAPAPSARDLAPERAPAAEGVDPAALDRYMNERQGSDGVSRFEIDRMLGPSEDNAALFRAATERMRQGEAPGAPRPSEPVAPAVRDGGQVEPRFARQIEPSERATIEGDPSVAAEASMESAGAAAAGTRRTMASMAKRLDAADEVTRQRLEIVRDRRALRDAGATAEEARGRAPIRPEVLERLDPAVRERLSNQPSRVGEAPRSSAENRKSAPEPAAEAPKMQAEKRTPPALPERIGGVDGREDAVRFEDGKKLATRYRVVEMGDVQQSHDPFGFAPNPRYPEGVQGREYGSDKWAQSHVAERTQKFDKDIVLSTAPEIGSGPPTIAPSGVAVAGNERTMLLKRLHELRPDAYAEYRAALEERASQFGIDPEAVRGMKRPMLVREIADESVDLTNPSVLRDLNAASDVSVAKAKDSLSNAGTRARKLQDAKNALGHFSETFDPEGTLTSYLRSGNGRRFVDFLVGDGVIPRAELPTLLDPDGKLTKNGVLAIEEMMLVGAVGDAQIANNAPAALLQKLEHAIPAIVKAAKVEEAVPGWDVRAAIRGALELHTQLAGYKDANTIDGLLGHGDLIGRTEDPMALQLARFLGWAKKAQVKEAFAGFAIDAGKAADHAASGDMFGWAPPGARERFAHWFGTEGEAFGAAVERGAYLSALEGRAAEMDKTPVTKQGWKLREVLLEALGKKPGSEISNAELVRQAVAEGKIDNGVLEAAARIYEQGGYWRMAMNPLMDPLLGGVMGGIAGGTAGAALDEENPERGFVVGASAGFLAGLGVRAGAEVVRRGAASRARDAERRAFRSLKGEAAEARGRGEFLRVSGDDPRLAARAPRSPLGVDVARQRGSILANERGGYTMGGQGDLGLDAVAPKVRLEERPRALGFVETWMRSAKDLFAKHDPHAGQIADEGAKAIDARNNFLDLRRTQVKAALSGLSKADKQELWRALDQYAVVSEVPMRVKAEVKDAFVAMRKMFRDDVLRLHEMKRSLLSHADRERLDTALTEFGSEKALPDDFPEHLRPLVAMKTGEWGIAAYWPHVFDGNWKVDAGAHTNYFPTRNEAEKYAQRLLTDKKWDADIAVTHELQASADMAHMLPREKYHALVQQLRASLGLDSGSIIQKTGDIIRPGPRKRFNAHEQARKVNLQTFLEDPEKALDLYYHRWSTKLAFDPFRVKSHELMGKVDPKIGGLKEELEDYVRRVQGLPSKNELALDATIRDWVLSASGGRIETKGFIARRAARRVNQFTAIAKLGWSPVSAAVNLMQTVHNTAPMLGERWTIQGAKEALAYSTAQLRGKVKDPHIEAMLRQTGALNLHPKHLVGEFEPLLSKNPLSAMYMFTKAENANRMIAAIGAYRKATAEGMGHGAAVDYVREVLRETQFRYDVADAPKIAANPFGKMVMQFQTYAIKEMEFAAKLWQRDKKAFGKFIAYIGAIGGVRGLLEGTPAHLIGDNISIEDEQGVKRTAGEWAGEKLPEWMAYGAMGLATGGDFSQRIGFGGKSELSPDGWPGPNLQAVADLAKAKQAYSEGNEERAGNLLRKTVLPLLAERAYTAWKIAETGEIRDTWGRTVREAQAGDVPKAAVGLRSIESTRTFDRESIRRRHQEEKAAGANRARGRIYDALDQRDYGSVGRIAREAAKEGVYILPSDIKNGYVDRRNPEVRSLRRTRAADRGSLLRSGVLERP